MEQEKQTVETEQTETPSQQQAEKQVGLTEQQVQDMLQRELDRVRNEYGKKLKTKEEELDQLRKSTMTDAEKREHELEEARKAITDRERAINERENKLYAVDALNKSQLPHAFLDFVVGDSEDVTNKKIDLLKAEFDKAVQVAVDSAFKQQGRTVQKGTGANITATDFAKMSYAEQIELYQENPALYKELANQE